MGLPWEPSDLAPCLRQSARTYAELFRNSLLQFQFLSCGLGWRSKGPVGTSPIPIISLFGAVQDSAGPTANFGVGRLAAGCDGRTRSSTEASPTAARMASMAWISSSIITVPFGAKRRDRDPLPGPLRRFGPSIGKHRSAFVAEGRTVRCERQKHPISPGLLPVKGCALS
jgi:hypothetical protein